MIEVIESIDPSLSNGYATGPGESAYPGLWDGLGVAWLPALGYQGGKLYDVSGFKKPGALTNMDAATDWTTDADGKIALDFDGSNDVVTSGYTLSGATEFSIEVWVTQAISGGSDDGGILTCNLSYDDAFFLGFGVNDITQFYVGTTVVRSPNDSFPRGVRHMLTATYKASDFMKIYINGVLSVTLSTSVPASVPSHTGVEIGNNLTIGLASAMSFSSCIVTERTLTDNEILERFTLGADAPFRLAEPSPFFVPAGFVFPGFKNTAIFKHMIGR